MGVFLFKQIKLCLLSFAVVLVPLTAYAASVDPFVDDTPPELLHHIIIDIPSRTLSLYHENKLVHVYPVGVGRPGFPSPVGSYHILCKINSPGWENPYSPKGAVRIKPGKNNPLGTRWMGFKDMPHAGQVGMHGTNEPNSVGKFVSHGCIRMHTHDAEKVFDQVGIGTPVTVTYNVVHIESKNRQVYLTYYPDPYHRGYPSAGKLHIAILKQFPNAVISDGQLNKAVRSHGIPNLSIATLPQIPAVTLAGKLAPKPASAAATSLSAPLTPAESTAANTPKPPTAGDSAVPAQAPAPAAVLPVSQPSTIMIPLEK